MPLTTTGYRGLPAQGQTLRIYLARNAYDGFTPDNHDGGYNVVGANGFEPLTPDGAGFTAYDYVLAGHYPAAIGTALDRLKINPADAEALALQAYAMVKINQAGCAIAPVARAMALTQTQPNSRARAFALVAQGAGGRAGKAQRCRRVVRLCGTH